MLTRRFYAFLLKVFPFFSRAGVFHYEWNPDAKLFVRNVNPGHLVNFHLITLATTFIFHIVQIIRYYMLREFRKVVILFTLTIATLLAMTSYTATVLCDGEFFYLLNTCLVLLKQMNRKLL